MSGIRIDRSSRAFLSAFASLTINKQNFDRHCCRLLVNGTNSNGHSWGEIEQHTQISFIFFLILFSVFFNWIADETMSQSSKLQNTDKKVQVLSVMEFLILRIEANNVIMTQTVDGKQPLSVIELNQSRRIIANDHSNHRPKASARPETMNEEQLNFPHRYFRSVKSIVILAIVCQTSIAATTFTLSSCLCDTCIKRARALECIA